MQLLWKLSPAGLALAAALAVAAPAASSGAEPSTIGTCVATAIQHFGWRNDDPNYGDIAYFENGVVLFGPEIDRVPQIKNALVGDQAELCRVSPPAGCDPAKVGPFYAAINLRTQEYWVLPTQPEACIEK